MTDKGKLFIGLTEMARLRYDYAKSLLTKTDGYKEGFNACLEEIEKNVREAEHD